MPPVRNHEVKLFPLCERHDFAGVVGAGGEWLFNQHMAACLQGGQRMLGVESVGRCDDNAIEVLREPRFKTTVDRSFLRGMGHDDPIYASPIRVFTGSADRPRIRADFAETSGTDRGAQAALDELRRAAEKMAIMICLGPGDLLLVDNNHAFHGRTPFRARWDGADRWLLRTSITRDLSRSAAHRPGDGRVIDVNYRDEVLTG